MTFMDDLDGMHADVFDEVGIDATVQRGAGGPVSVRIVVAYGKQRLGEYGQVVARVDRADFLVSQWQPQQGDIVRWTDLLGAHTRTVAAPDDDNGFVAKAVLRG